MIGKDRQMDQEAQPNCQEDAYRKRIIRFMILMGVSHSLMFIFLGAALTSQLAIFNWLTWLFAAMLAVTGCVTVTLLVRFLRLIRSR